MHDRTPAEYAARVTEIVADLSAGDRNIMNQSKQLAPITAYYARLEGFDETLLAKLVRERVEAGVHLREAALRKVGDRYAPTHRERREDTRHREPREGRGLYGRGY
jgi:hypothetical protein